ncbi:MAG: galactose-1-phosphate uridylyltransferase, partial [Candidatus Omnitrophica bacterium]|nr:galactose-1-phosphate uridylyltransferase [Candidatus Omnitrophota bacterium]
MSELRRDPITGRWNIINTDEPTGPDGFEIDRRKAGGTVCPFCPGNEQLTPPEIYAVRPPEGGANGPGWELRVIPNKFPALRVEGDLARRGLGLFDLSNGIGAHEVIIESPDHQKQMADLTLQELNHTLAAYRIRSLDLRGDRRLKYTLLFKNVGLVAGASLEHTHSQLIALPIVPKRVQEELKGAEQYFEFRERCPFCDMIQQELYEDERIVADNRNFLAFCPFVSSFPFETWILPKLHSSDFVSMGADTMADMARILKEVLIRLRLALSDPSYNFLIHTGPIEPREREAYHWHVELIPKLTKVAGFEWGTGFYINPTPPEFAAKLLRDVSIPVAAV